MWLIVVYLLHTCGELTLSPVGLSAMSKLAPVRIGGLIMGVWFLGSAVGNYIGGRLAAAGFTCERIDRGAVKNLWARHGQGAPVVCLATAHPAKFPDAVEQATGIRPPLPPALADHYLGVSQDDWIGKYRTVLDEMLAGGLKEKRGAFHIDALVQGGILQARPDAGACGDLVDPGAGKAAAGEFPPRRRQQFPAGCGRIAPLRLGIVRSFFGHFQPNS